MIKPTLRQLRRDESTVQIGLDPRRAILLSGPGTAAVLHAMDGTRDRGQVLAAVRASGTAEDAAAKVLDTLAARGVLDDAGTDNAPLRELALNERDRLRPDLASASLLTGGTGAGLPVLAGRRRRTVHVYGAGRVGSTVATLLAASGVGTVRPIDPARARPADAAPAGYTGDASETRESAAAASLRRLAPSTGTDHSGHPDLAILAPVDGLDPDLTLCDTLLRDGVPHLLVSIREATGTVGPLVYPAGSSCLRCQHLYRVDRDPAWPRLAAQLSAPHTGIEACDAVLATAVGALGATQALAYLDGSEEPGLTGNGSLDITLPDLRWRRRSWPIHPRCGCHWNEA